MGKAVSRILELIKSGETHSSKMVVELQKLNLPE